MSVFKLLVNNNQIPLSESSTASNWHIPCASAEEFLSFFKLVKQISHHDSISIMRDDVVIMELQGLCDISNLDVLETEDGLFLNCFADGVAHNNSDLTLQNLSFLEIGKSIVNKYNETSKTNDLLSDSAIMASALKKDNNLTAQIAELADIKRREENV